MHDLIDEQLLSLAEFRRDLHRNPELGFEEHRTARLIQKMLVGYGIPYESGIAATGIVATIEGKKGRGKTVALRADMDALPLQEASGVPHRSSVPGKMHACGHDGHTTILLGAAYLLSRARDFSGSVKLIFQPAEEGLGGAKAMLDEGLLERHGIDEIFALHNWPALRQGQIAVLDGPAMAASDQLTLTIRGVGGHGGVNPHTCIDPVHISSFVIQALHAIPSRQLSPGQRAVISLCAIEGGVLSAFSVIPDVVTISGTVRTLDYQTSQLIEDSIRRICHGIACCYNASIEVEYIRKYPVTRNSPRCSDLVRASAVSLFGEDCLTQDIEPSFGAEDFSFFLEKIPGAYFFLGAAVHGSSVSPALHNSMYDFNDELIGPGARMMADVALRCLAGEMSG